MEKLVRRPLNIRIWLLLPLLLTAGISNAQFIKALVPDAAVAQYAGSIGYGSIGAGYDLFRKKKGNLDLIYGFVPRSKGGSLHIVTAKFAYRPFTIKLGNAVTLYPINPGVFFSYHIGEEFNVSWDDEFYEKGYYWWSPAIRSHVSFSNELKLNTQKLLNDKGLKYVTLYSEFNTNDLYLVTWYKNQETMPITKIFKIGLGVRVAF